MKNFDYDYFAKLKPLSNFDILNNKKGIKHFRGVFMRDNLPSKPRINECGIINLDSVQNSGTHWVCYFIGKQCYYFDSFGLFPPDEVKKYLLSSAQLLTSKNYILSSTFVLQEFNTSYCGYICLYVLQNLSKGFKYEDIIFNLVENFNLVKTLG